MRIQISSEISSRQVLLKLHPVHEIQNVVLFLWRFIFSQNVVFRMAKLIFVCSL